MVERNKKTLKEIEELVNNEFFIGLVVEKNDKETLFLPEEEFSGYSKDDIEVARNIVIAIRDSKKQKSSRKDQIWKTISKKSFGHEISLNESKKVKSSNSKHSGNFRLKGKVKYVAAAVLVGVLVASYFLKDNLFSASNTSVPIIATNTIGTGTNKATLTLADGSQVVLENNLNFQTENLNSNGEEIVYTKNSKQNSREIEYNYLTIPRGGEYFVELSDGTQVWLNSETQLKYPVHFIEEEPRQVELVYGEAYFDVSPSSLHKGTKFEVYNNVQEVEVLGTKFNIKAYKDEQSIYTTLVEGKVTINTSTTQQLLVPNEQSVLNITNKEMEVSVVDVKSEIAWIDGNFVFQRKSLKDIMKVLSRWYNVDIEFQKKEIEEIRFNGELSKSKDLKKILVLIKNTNYINDFEINGKKIILK